MGRGREVALACVAMTCAVRAAAAEPSDRTLVLVGLGLAVPTYVAGVTLHEGSHALAAKLVGANVDELHLFPPGVDPHVGTFRFGWTYVTGLRTRGERAVFYIAPKITDTVLLGGFAALAFSHVWPHDRYAQLALTVGATGLWVDFAKDVVLRRETNDIMQFFRETCLVGWREWIARAVYLGADVGLGLVVARGYERTFSHSATSTVVTRVAPLWSASF